MTIQPKTIAWTLAAIGGACGIAAAYFGGGLIPGLMAASSAFTAAAGILGYSQLPPAPPAPGAPQ